MAAAIGRYGGRMAHSALTPSPWSNV
jgi:hypothetical protein